WDVHRRVARAAGGSLADPADGPPGGSDRGGALAGRRGFSALRGADRSAANPEKRSPRHRPGPSRRRPATPPPARRPPPAPNRPTRCSPHRCPPPPPLRPRDLAVLLLASRELLPRQRARDQEPDLAGLALKRRILDRLAALDPEPHDMEATLMRIVEEFG